MQYTVEHPRQNSKVNDPQQFLPLSATKTTPGATTHQCNLLVRHKGDRVRAAAPRHALAVAVIENILERNQTSAQLLRGRQLVAILIVVGIVIAFVLATAIMLTIAADTSDAILRLVATCNGRRIARILIRQRPT